MTFSSALVGCGHRPVVCLCVKAKITLSRFPVMAAAYLLQTPV